MTDKERIVFLESSLDRVIKILETQAKTINLLSERIDVVNERINIIRLALP